MPVRSVPKPRRSPKGKRAHNSTLPAPTTALRSTKPIAKRNAARRKKEWARTYGSSERVEWVKRQPCAWCVFRGLVRVSGPSENAHVRTEGLGRKAGAAAIAPLCRAHHRAYDGYRAPFDRRSERFAVAILGSGSICP